jgi:hypothetical protein
MLKRVISGGQSGADQAAIRAARAAGIPTGGTAPRGWIAEVPDGPSRWVHRPCPWLADFGLVECPEPTGEMPDPADARRWREWLVRCYPPRVRANLRDSDGTIWFGGRGTRALRVTHGVALERGWEYPFCILRDGTTPGEMLAWLEMHEIATLNVTGTRESVNPGIGGRTEAFLGEIFRHVR